MTYFSHSTIRDGCQFIAGTEVTDHKKCGQATYGRSVYCREHYHLCVRPQCNGNGDGAVAHVLDYTIFSRAV